MGKYRSFRDDEQIGKKLDLIPKNEKSTVIRMALRQYFGISDETPAEPITTDVARQVARELMRNLKVEKKY